MQKEVENWGKGAWVNNLFDFLLKSDFICFGLHLNYFT